MDTQSEPRQSSDQPDPFNVPMETILGVRVGAFTYATLLEKVDCYIQERRKGMILAINPEKIVKAQSDPSLRELLNQAEFPIADGVGILLASRLQGGVIRSRMTGIDTMLSLCRHAAAKGYRVFLLGAKPGVADAAARSLQKRFSGLQIVGTQDGYFQDEQSVVEKINKSGADILFVGMGSPKQEYWIRQHCQHLIPSVFQGVGGSYDVICGNIPRAPRWMQRAGLEWFYRLLKEPSRWRRQLALLKFLWLLWRRK